MEQVLAWQTAPLALFEQSPGVLVAAFTDGLATVRGADLTWAWRGPVQSVAMGPDRRCYALSAGRAWCLDPLGSAAPEDITARFGGRPQDKGRISCTGTGEIWVEGCTTHRDINGQFAANPAAATTPWPPAAQLIDMYGITWACLEHGGFTQVLLVPPNAPGEWVHAGVDAGVWRWLIADSVGYTWLVGPSGWRRLAPRQAENGWQDLDGPVPGEAVTAASLSPAGLLLVGANDGTINECDATAVGDTQARWVAQAPSAARCLLSDSAGAVWAATDQGLYRQPPAATAWQHDWQLLPGRLPGGGNHDVFAATCAGRLWIAGGWAGQWGLPARAHVPDQLFALDPASGYWQVASRMYMPRRYHGIAALDGRVWVIGGEARFGPRPEPHQALYLVDVFDPQSGTWSTGPSLNFVRTDPFVVTCGNRIYAIGGAAHNEGPKLDTVESIGPGETAWRIETPLPEPTRQGHACALDGIIYCFSIDGAFAYDTVSRAWDSALPQPGPIGQGPLAAAYQGLVWLLGGYHDASVRCYDPQARRWTPGPDLPVEQAWAAAEVLDGRLYISGGAHFSAPHQAIVFDDRTWVLRQSSVA
jgi:hypothetical protein